ncbi:putative dsRNA-binding protein [Spirillospora sp. CA-128828]|uniref:putative dsRNA-binding protein n=1 Tax=Spirillospora sp. CA-128828 TaxID=3240033 RepID=UPI003D8A2813
MATNPEPQLDPAKDLVTILNAFGVDVQRPALLKQTLTRGNKSSEFLGEPLIALAVTEMVSDAEVPRSLRVELRDTLLSTETLAEVARYLRFGDYIKPSRSNNGTSGGDEQSILASRLKAVTAAVHKDCGPAAASMLVKYLFTEPLEDLIAELGTWPTSARSQVDWTTVLQQLGSREPAGRRTPVYTFTERGYEHSKMFVAKVTIGGVTYGPGKPGRNKPEARRHAAKIAVRSLLLVQRAAGPVPAADGGAEPDHNKEGAGS